MTIGVGLKWNNYSSRSVYLRF